MPAPRLDTKMPIYIRVPAAKLALTGIVPVLAVLALAPFLPRLGLAHLVAQPAVATEQGPAWAGDLDNLQTVSGGPKPAVSSTSYTSGFDAAAAGLTTLKSSQVASRVLLPARVEAHSCAEEPSPPHASTCGKLAKVFAQPTPRPTELKFTTRQAEGKAAQKHAGGIFGFSPQLPTTRQLLSPFTFVSDKVTGLFKRS